MFKKSKLDVSALIGEEVTDETRREWILLTKVAYLPNETAEELQVMAQKLSSNDVAAVMEVARQIFAVVVVNWNLIGRDDELWPKPADLKHSADGSFEAKIREVPLAVLMAAQELAFEDDGSIPLEKSSESGNTSQNLQNTERSSQPVVLIAPPSLTG